MSTELFDLDYEYLLYDHNNMVKTFINKHG